MYSIRDCWARAKSPCWVDWVGQLSNLRGVFRFKEKEEEVEGIAHYRHT